MVIEKILTDVPFLDEIVYYTKILALNTVLKNPTDAENNETTESAQAASLYLASVDNYLIFEQVDINYEMVTFDPKNGLNLGIFNKWALTPDELTPEDKKYIIEVAKRYIISKYVEKNNYYRMLNGLPDINDKGIMISDIYNILKDSDKIDTAVIDVNKYVHEMDNDEINYLTGIGIINNLIEQYPDKKYLKFLGEKKIDPYYARKAERFKVLYLPTIDSVEIYDKYKTRLDINRVYTLKTIYSDAFKFGSSFYDAFIIVLIIIQTMLDLISSLQEFVVNKEIFDLRSIQYIFQSNGIPFFPEIPTKYQIAMVKNLNTLIKYKSTSKNMVDICSLFGYDNIEIFKYYLLKDPILDAEGKYTFNDDGSMACDLKFVRIPLNDNADDYINNYDNYVSYNEVTTSDPSWNGGEDPDYIKGLILKEEFNYIRSKYISIDTVYDIAKMSTEMAYFYNILFDYNETVGNNKNNLKLEEEINPTLNIPSLGESGFKLTDIFCYMFALAYIYNGINDDIMDTQGKILHVTGFNFKTDLAELASYVENKGFTLEDLLTDSTGKVLSFTNPTTNINSYQSLKKLFIDNSKIRDHIIEQMANADNKKIYDIYNHLYNSLMISKFNNEYFKKPIQKDKIFKSIDEAEAYAKSADEGEKIGITRFIDDGINSYSVYKIIIKDGNKVLEESYDDMYSTYEEYLNVKSPTLGASLTEIKSITDRTVQIQKISSVINEIIYTLDQDQYISSSEFKYLYSKIPSVSSEHIKNYMTKVIDFFKSYKIDLIGIDTIYKIDDKLDGLIRAIDNLTINSVFDKSERAHYIDTFTNLLVDSTKTDNYDISEKIYFDISRWVNNNFKDVSESIKNEIIRFIATREFKEIVSNNNDPKLDQIKDKILFNVYKNTLDKVFGLDSFNELRAKTNKDEYYNIFDNLYIIDNQS